MPLASITSLTGQIMVSTNNSHNVDAHLQLKLEKATNHSPMSHSMKAWTKKLNWQLHLLLLKPKLILLPMLVSKMENFQLTLMSTDWLLLLFWFLFSNWFSVSSFASILKVKLELRKQEKSNKKLISIHSCTNSTNKWPTKNKLCTNFTEDKMVKVVLQDQLASSEHALKQD